MPTSCSLSKGTSTSGEETSRCPDGLETRSVVISSKKVNVSMMCMVDICGGCDCGVRFSVSEVYKPSERGEFYTSGSAPNRTTMPMMSEHSPRNFSHCTFSGLAGGDEICDKTLLQLATQLATICLFFTRQNPR